MDERKKFALLRIAFGIVWLIDAWFKWQPQFISGFTGYLTNALENQPSFLQIWINAWIRLVSGAPAFFAYTVAILETLIALSLIFGLFTRYVIYGGIFLSLVIWSVPQGFGGPYRPGSTDIGAGIIYVFVFAALLIGKSWERLSLEAWFRKRRVISVAR